jgi:hypothetical protein
LLIIFVWSVIHFCLAVNMRLYKQTSFDYNKLF